MISNLRSDGLSQLFTWMSIEKKKIEEKNKEGNYFILFRTSILLPIYIYYPHNPWSTI